MASDQIMLTIRLAPDDETMAVILAMLNMWQDANPDLMVAMVPAKDRYEYEIIRKRRANNEQGTAGGADHANTAGD